MWTEVKKGWRWVRSDGAVVKYDIHSPYPNPEDPKSKLWTAWEPDPSDRYIAMYSKRGRGWPRRYLTAQAAMKKVDELFPLAR